MLKAGSRDAGTAPAKAQDTPRLGRVALLAAGDVIIFLLFAALGRSQHHETQTVGTIANTAAPFIVGWLITAPWCGAFGFRGSAATTRPARLLRRTAPAWVAAWVVGLALRALVWRRDIPPTFDLIALLFNAVLLLGWRGAVSALFWRR